MHRLKIGGGACGRRVPQVALYAVEAPENWFEDAGSGQLSNGSATVALDSTFAQTVNTGIEYHVFLTPNGDCKGLYVSRKSASSFEVHELGGGHSSIAFDYRIMAKRVNYENIRLADVTGQYQEMQQQHQLRRERMEQRRCLLMDRRVGGLPERGCLWPRERRLQKPKIADVWLLPQRPHRDVEQLLEL